MFTFTLIDDATCDVMSICAEMTSLLVLSCLSLFLYMMVLMGLFTLLLFLLLLLFERAKSTTAKFNIIGSDRSV